MKIEASWFLRGAYEMSVHLFPCVTNEDRLRWVAQMATASKDLQRIFNADDVEEALEQTNHKAWRREYAD